MPSRSKNPLPHLPLKPATDIQAEIRSLSRSYQSALKKYLLRSPGSKVAPVPDRRLGNLTVKLGVDLLGLAKIHENAFTALEADGTLAKAKTERSAAFFDAVVVPIEESRFYASEANNRLMATIKNLTRRTEELDSSNKSLTEEVAHSKEVETSLRTSEETTRSLLKEAHEMQEEMRSLSRRLITAQENERKRISRELHDVIAQTLAGINIRLAVLRSQSAINSVDFLEKIGNTERLVEQSVEIVHRFSSDLRPVVLDDIGLIPALRAYIAAFTELYGIPVKLVASPAIEELDNSSLTTLFRITQEAFNNIGRYSKASHVKFDLRQTKNSFRMKLEDDGEGFQLKGKTSAHKSKRLGILGMRERAHMVGGSFKIDSTLGVGTIIQVEIPRAATVPETPLETDQGTSNPIT